MSIGRPPPRRRVPVAASAALAIFAVTSLAAGARPAAALLINTETLGVQESAAVAATPAGEFLVVWESAGGLRGQRYSAQGLAAGAELAVAPAPAVTPAVTHLAPGGFLVVWAATDGVLGLVLDGDGQAVGGPFPIAPGAPSDQRSPDVAVNTKGRGLVTWTSIDVAESDVWARRLRVDGRPRGSEFLVNAFTTGTQWAPRVATTRPARFVVVWTSDGARDGSETAIFAQRIRRTGKKIGTEFLVNTYTTGVQSSADVSAGRNASFVVVWGGVATYATGPQGNYGADSAGIRAQRFTRGARKLGTEFVASTFDYGPHRYPRVDSDETGRFVVAWVQGENYDYLYSLGTGETCGSTIGGRPSFVCQDGSGLGVVHQTFDEHAQKIGSEVSSTGHRDQHEADVAVAPAGRFVVVWTDAGCLTAENYACRYSGHSPDGSESGVFGATGELPAPASSAR